VSGGIEDMLTKVFQRWLDKRDCLDRIDFVETTIDYRGRPTYVGTIKTCLRTIANSSQKTTVGI